MAGAARMTYSHYLAYDVFGGLFWVGSTVLGGYFLGRLVGPEILSRRIHWVIAVVVFLSLLPAIFGVLRAKFQKPQKVTTSLSPPQPDAEAGQD